jgi:hypothetical protein
MKNDIKTVKAAHNSSSKIKAKSATENALFAALLPNDGVAKHFSAKMSRRKVLTPMEGIDEVLEEGLVASDSTITSEKFAAAPSETRRDASNVDASNASPSGAESPAAEAPIASVPVDTVAIGALPESAAAPWAALNAGGLAIGPLLAGVAGVGALAGGGGASVALAQAPSQPKSLGGALAETSDSGNKGDNKTGDNTPTIKGVTAPGSKVTVQIDTNGDGIPDVVLTSIADAQGNWEVTPGSPLPDGVFLVKVIGTDSTGVALPPFSMPLIIDSSVVAPTAAQDPASDSATKGDSITNDSTPTLVGTGTAGDKVNVTIGGQTLSATVAADGTWSVTPPLALVDGPYEALVRTIDDAGNQSEAIKVAVIVDTSIAVNPVLAPISDSGTPGDSLTNDKTPTISGTGTPGDSIKVTSPVGEVLTAIVDAKGQWSVSPTLELPEGGPQQFAVTASDKAGNTANAIVAVTIDTVAPIAPLAVLDSASDSSLLGDTITNDTTPTITGTGHPGDTITVTSPTGEAMTTVVAANGTWTVTPAKALPEGGPQEFQVSATDPAGNVSPVALVPVIIDSIAPTLTGVLTLSSDSGVAGDNITKDTLPTFSGSGEPGQIIKLNLPTGEVLEVLVQPDGSWTATATKAFPEGGPQDVRITSTDVAGNVSEVTVPVTIDTLATLAPTVTISGDANNDTFLNITELGSATTVGVKIGLPVGAVAGDTIHLISNGIVTDILLSPANISTGYVEAQVARPADAESLSVTASLIDIAGNASPSATDSALVDTTPPGALMTTITTDSSNDEVINAAELGALATVAVTISLPANAAIGDTLVVTDNAGNSKSFVLDAASIAAHQVLTTFPVPSEDQTIQINAQLTDPAGNSSAVASDAATKDTFAPGAPVVTLTDDANNDGFLDTAEVGSKTTVAVSIALPNNPLLPTKVGDTLHVTNGAITVDIVLTAEDIAAGTVFTSLPMPSDGATLTVSAFLSDAGGNPSPLSSDSAMVDTTALADPVVTILEDINNDGFINTTELLGQVDVSVALPPGAAAGDTVTVTDNAGNMRTVTLTALLASAGHVEVSFPAPANTATFSVTASLTDQAGNPGAISAPDTASIDTLAPLAPVAILAAASDSGVAGDNRTFDTTPTISGTGTPGDTIKVTGPLGEVLTTVVAPNGTWSVDSLTVLAEGGPHDFSVTATDPAGNVSPVALVPVTIDTTAPGPLTATLSPASDSGLVGDMLTKDDTPTISGTGEPGAKISVSIDGQSLTATVALDGTWQVTPAHLVDGTYVAAVIETDAAGNTSTTTANVEVDTSAPAATLASNVVTTDNVLNIAESQLGAVPVSGTIAGEFQTGDIVTLTIAGIAYTGAVNAVGVFSIDVPGSALAADSDQVIDVSAVVHDAAGNFANITDTQTYSTDLAAPTVSLAANNITADNVINIAEGSAAAIPLTGTVTGEFIAGDLVTLIINGSSYTGPVDGAGHYSINVPGVALLADADKTIAISFTTTDSAGNSTVVATTKAYAIDLVAPSLSISINPVTADNVINIAEGGSAAVPVTGTVAGQFNDGDNVSLSVNGKTFTGTVDATGLFSINVPGTDLLADSDKGITATVSTQDAAGNPASASGSNTYSIDVLAPVITLSINPVTLDNVLNIAESVSSAIAVTGTATGDFRAGDTVTLNINGSTFTGTLNAAGNFSIDVPGADLLADPDATILGSLSTTDLAGNSSTVTATRVYGSDVLAPAPTIVVDHVTADNVINIAEASVTNTPITGTVSGDFKAGDSVVLTVNGETFSGAIDALGHYSIPVMNTALLADPDHSIAVSFITTDEAGNSTTITASKPYLIDTVAPNAPTVSISSDADNNGYVNNVEATSPTTLNVRVDFPSTGPALQAGDSIVIVSNTGTTTTVILTSLEVSNGYIVSQVTAPSNGALLSVTASAIDAAGNSSPSSIDNAILDNTVSTVSVSILSDSNDDQILNQAEMGSSTTVAVRVSFDNTTATLGDIVHVTDGLGNVRDFTLTAANLSAGFIDTSFPKPNEDQVITINASLTDTAGNVTVAIPDAALVDTLPPGTPTVELLADANNDGFINSGEAGATTDVRVNLPPPPSGPGAPYTAPAIGDTITIFAADGTTLLGTHILDASDLSNGNFVFTGIALPADGSTLTVKAQLTDGSGNRDPGWTLGTPGSDSATIDTTAPTVAVTHASSGGLLNGATDTITFTLSEASTSFSAADIIILGDGILSNFSGSGTTYTATLTMGSGNTTVSIGNNAFTDAAGNANQDAAQADNASLSLAANDAPINTLASSYSATEDTPLTITGLAVSDVDAGTTTMSMTLSVAHGVLNVSGGAAAITGNGTNSVILTGTQAEINATLSALNAVQYSPSANYNGADQLSIVSNDAGGFGTGGVLSTTSTVSLTVAAVNDAPVNTLPASGVSTPEDSPVSISGLSVADVDAATGALQITLSVVHGVLNLSAGAGVTVTSNGSGSVILSGSQADLNALLATPNAVRYTPSSNYNGADTLTMVSNDNGNTGGIAAVTSSSLPITVTQVNDAPVLQIDGTNLVLNGSFQSGATGWTGNSGVEASYSSATYGLPAIHGTIVAEVEGLSLSPTTNRSYIQQVITTVPGETYTFAIQAGTRAVNTNDSGTLAVDGVELLHFTTSNNWGTYATTFVATGTSTTLRIYSDGSATGYGLPGDGTGLIVDNVVVAKSNAAYTENGPAIQILTGSTLITDIDDTNIESATFAMSNAQPGDQVLVGGSSAAAGLLASGISWTKTGTSVSFSGSASKADYTAALQALQFQNTTELSAPNIVRDFTVRVNDGDLNSNTASGRIYVTAPNDAPVGTDVTLSATEDTAYIFSAANFGFTDPNDSPAHVLQSVIITSLPTTGSLTLSGDPVVAGQIIGAAQLSSLVWTPATNANGNGAATLSFQVVDSGGTLNGGQNTDQSPNTITFNVAAVNDAPVASAVTATGNEDVALITLSLAGSDVDGTVASAKVTSLPSASQGVLYLADGTTPVTTLMVLTPEQMSSLVFKPTANYNGAVNIPFTVTDNGGLTSSITNAAITIAAVNDAPVNTLPAGGYTTTAGSSLAVSALSINDVDAGTSTLTVTLQVSSGTLSALSAAGVTATGSGTNTITLNGTATDINAYLASITNQPSFVPGAFVGTAVLTMTTNDNGNSGAGAAKIDVDTTNIKVQVPTVADAKTALEDTVVTGNVLSNDGAGYTDVTAFSVSGIAGSFAPGATAVIANVGTVTVAATGSYTFTPVKDWSGTVPTITYTGDGASVPASNNTLDINLTALSDTPVGVAPATLTGYAVVGFSTPNLSTTAQLSQATLQTKLGVGATWADSFAPTSDLDTVSNGLTIGTISFSGTAGAANRKVSISGTAPGVADGTVVTLTLYADLASQATPMTVTATVTGGVFSVTNQNISILHDNDVSGTSGISTNPLVVQASATSGSASLYASKATDAAFNTATINGVDGDIRTLSIDMVAGDNFLTNWRFQSDENRGSGYVASGYEDFAIMHIVAPDGSFVDKIISNGESYLRAIRSDTANTALWQAGSTGFTATQSGSYSVSYVVMNGGDNYLGARLIVDSILSPKRVDLPLVEFNDIDGSESFNSIQLSGLTGYSLSAGTDLGGGTWSLTQADLQSLQLVLPNGATTGTLNLTLTATSVETSTGIVSSTLTHNFAVNIDAIKLTDAAGTATHDYIGGDSAANALGGAAGTDGDDILDGLAGNDTLMGGNGNDKLLGGLGNDILNGGAGLDVLTGGKGNDTMTGGTGRDIFKWLAADKGLAGTPAADIITDFASGASGDVIDLRSLLQGATPGHYQDFININVVAGTTTLRISSTGGYGAGYNAAATDQTIQLNGVDVTVGNNGFLINSLNDLVTNGNLLVL